MLPSHATLRLEWYGTGHHSATHSETVQPPRSAARSLAEIGGTGAGLELRWGRHHLRWGSLGVEETGGANPKQIEHPLLDLIAQRVFGLALGYEDLNDHDELRSDPMLAVALAKDDPKGQQRRRAQDRGKALAGKSTLNRLELTAPDYDGSPRQKESNKPETKKIVVDPESIDALLVDLFLEAHAQAPERIILDLDATDDILYGQQEGRFYHGYYHDYCYLPLYVFCGEHLLCARLRMSNIDASADSVEELEPVVARIRQRWPAVEIPVSYTHLRAHETRHDLVCRL